MDKPNSIPNIECSCGMVIVPEIDAVRVSCICSKVYRLIKDGKPIIWGKEARPWNNDKKKKFSLGTQMIYEGQKYYYCKAGSDINVNKLI